MSDSISKIDTQELVAYLAAVREMLEELEATGCLSDTEEWVLTHIDELDRRTRALERRLRG